MASVTSAAVDSGDSEDQLSPNSQKRQHNIDAQAAKITTVKAELNKALEENKKLKNLFSPEKMVEAMTKAVSAMTMQSHPKTLKGTQYQGASNYIGRQQQPQLAHGANGMLEPNMTCFYCKDTRHTKNNCVWLKNKMVCNLAQEQVTTKQGITKKVPVLKYQKNIGSSDLGPV